jgi:phage gp36-like protein
MPANTAAYCQLIDIQNRLSAAGVAARVDDTPPTTLGDVIDEASRKVDEHCQTRYGTNLSKSNIVKHWTATIAATLLCERRGNPVPNSLARRYQETMDAMEHVLLHGRLIPDIAERKAGVPVMSNVHTQLLPYPHTVVETGTRRSTGKPEQYTQNKDVIDNYVYDYVI